jgi:phage terminase large subunit
MSERLTPELMERFFKRYGPLGGIRAPYRFVREVLGVQPDRWQRRALLLYGMRERHISVRSCHGVGKTAWLAWIIIHHSIFYYPQKTIATAPSKDQLEDALVAEVMTWFYKLPAEIQSWYEPLNNRLELKKNREGSFFSARTAREEKPEALAGIHSANVLIVPDEASGVPEPIFEAGMGSMSTENAMTAMAGNPTRTSGLFFDTHNRLRHSWATLWVCGDKKYYDEYVKAHGRKGAYYSPRVTAEFVQEVGDTYGFDSNQYRVRVLGEFPKSSGDTVIPYELIAAAKMRDIFVAKTAPRVWGLDVGRGGDASALVERTARSVNVPLLQWTSDDLMEVAGRVYRKWLDTALELRPQEIFVDIIGMGGGVHDRLRELGLPVRGVNVSETKSLRDPERFRDLRTELWYAGRDWFAKRGSTLPNRCECPECKRQPESKNHMVMLEIELGAQVAKLTSTGRLLCLPKIEMKKKLNGKSPNLADAFMLTFAGDAATLTNGPERTTTVFPWNQPLPSHRASV